jgi:hypothetical protein
MVAATRPQRAYDHRLREFVHRSGSDLHAVGIAIPRSTLHSWKSRVPKPVVGLVASDKTIRKLEAEVVRLNLQVRKLRCILRLLLVLLKMSGFRLESLRLPQGKNKQRLLREVDRACQNYPPILFVLVLSETVLVLVLVLVLDSLDGCDAKASFYADGLRVRVPLVC